jgi:hypothetical protein
MNTLNENQQAFIKAYSDDVAMVSDEYLVEFFRLKEIGGDYYEVFSSEGSHMEDCWSLWNSALDYQAQQKVKAVIVSSAESGIDVYSEGDVIDLTLIEPDRLDNPWNESEFNEEIDSWESHIHLVPDWIKDTYKKREKEYCVTMAYWISEKVFASSGAEAIRIAKEARAEIDLVDGYVPLAEELA